MMRCLTCIAALLLVLPALLHAQSADEKFIYIYAMIQEGDNMVAQGRPTDAIAKYREAQAGLKQLQEVYPSWSPKVVNYRLAYVQSQLAPLEAKLNVPPAMAAATNQIQTNAVVAANAPAMPAEPPALPPTEKASTNDIAQIRALQEQIAMLTRQNATLEAKLKEAWRVQPTADPQELAKTQQSMMELQKERDLLRASLEQAKMNKPEESTSALEQERKILADVRQQLAQQTELVATLQKENEMLKGQVASLKESNPSTDLVMELQITKIALAAMRATNVALLTDKIVLQNQLADFTRDGAPRSNLRDVERERDDLRRRLDAATRQLAKRKKSAGGADDAQFQTALARLQIYESKPIPYSPEELALFKQPDTKVVISDPAIAKRKPRELPPGAGPLMADAQRAMEAGRFDQAEAKLTEILRQDENNILVLGHLASVQMDQNRLADAEKTLTKALAVDAQDPASLYLMGRLRLLQEKYDEALDALSMSAKVMPDDPRTQYWLGKVLIQKGQRAAAETALRKAVQLRPGWGEAHYSLAMVYATQQPPFKELAQWHYQKAITSGYPRNVDFEKLIEQKRVAAQ